MENNQKREKNKKKESESKSGDNWIGKWINWGNQTN